MRFDASKKTLEIPVRALADEQQFRRIGFSGESWGGLALGAELHSRALKRRQAGISGYRTEVAVRFQLRLRAGRRLAASRR